MKNYSFLIVFVVLISIVFPQEKKRYLVQFTDKDSTVFLPLNQLVSQKSLQRRIRQNNYCILADISEQPIKPEYIVAVERTGAKIRHQLRWSNAISVYADNSCIARISELPGVQKVREIAKMQRSTVNIIQGVPNFFNASTLGSKSGLSTDVQIQQSEIDRVRKMGISGKGVIVGIIDTGFDLQHEVFSSLDVVGEYDFIQNDTITVNQTGDLFTQDQHGTYVLSILAGNRNGVFQGVAPDVSVVLAKTENVSSETHVEEDDLARALEWMDSIGVDIVSISLGYNEFDKGQYSYTYKSLNGKSTIVSRAVNKAIANGITVFCAAGNEGNKSWKYILAPADAYEVLSVGAIDADTVLAEFSGHGPTYDGRIKPELTALGVNVYGAASGSVANYLYQNGTSSATPIAAGIGALTLSAFPFLSQSVLRDMIIRGCASYPNAVNNSGYGLISAFKTISLPVIERNNTGVAIWKYFLEPQTSAPKLFLSKGNGDYIQIEGAGNDSRSVFNIPKNYQTHRADFFITYIDSAGKEKRYPKSGVYMTNNWIDVKTYTGFQSVNTNSNWYPNPFNKKVFNDISVSVPGPVRIAIFAVSGECVNEQQDFVYNAGTYLYEWDGTNMSGHKVGSGIYIALITADGKSTYSKIVYLR